MSRGDDGLQIKTDVDVLTDADCITMDGGDLRTGIGGMIDDRIEELIDGAPEELDTLKEIANELAENKSGVTTIIKKLGDKADSTDIKTKLSEMTEDENHRTVTDTEKTTWNNKVDKDGNKILSTNDFTDEYKELVDYSFQAIELGFDKDEPDKSIIINLENIKGRVFDSVRLNAASQDQIGLMSKEDKKKLDDIEAGAQKNAVTSVNGQVGDVKIDILEMDLTGYAKTKDLKPEAFKYKTMTAVIDQSNSNPLTCITYEDDAKTMEKGSADWDSFFKSQLVLFKDGKEIRDLKDEELDSLTEADGDVMVKFPRKGLNIKTVGDKVYVTMTDNPNNPDFKYYAHTRGEERREAFYLGAYLGYEKDGKLRSIKGFEPTGSKTIGNFRSIAQANGAGYEQLAFYQWTFLQAMYVLKYGSLDSQTVLGQGAVGSGSYLPTGATNGKGIDYGTTSSSVQMRFQYLEDMWGNKYQWLDGIKSIGNSQMKAGTDKFSNDGTNYSAYDLGFGENVYQYPKSVQGTSELGFVIKEKGGSQTTYFCDYQDVYGNKEKFGHVGGFRGSRADAGVFCFSCYSSASISNAIIGSRLMFL